MSALAAKRILVTRPRAQAGALCERLEACGAEAIEFPTIAIAPVADYSALDGALGTLASCRWVIFTSANGVATVMDRLPAAARPVLAGCRVAAIGPATARALELRGVRVDLVPDEYVAEAIVDGMGDVRGQRVLLPRADIAREALASELARRGAAVHEIAVYHTVAAQPDASAWDELRRGIDAITFTSASTARHFAALVGQPDVALADDPRLAGAAIACIGPITAEAVRALGLPVDVLARTYTTEGLVAALEEYFS